MAKATPPAPVKLYTSSSLVSSCPSGAAKRQKNNCKILYIFRSQNFSLLEIDRIEVKVCLWFNRILTLPNTNFSFPGPFITASVARYWSPKACLPMHIGFVQPKQKPVINTSYHKAKFRYQISSIYLGT
jgi:hypothetical protein